MLILASESEASEKPQGSRGSVSTPKFVFQKEKLQLKGRGGPIVAVPIGKPMILSKTMVFQLQTLKLEGRGGLFTLKT